MQHQSDINQDFVSVSPFFGVSFIAGLKTAGDIIEISYEPILLYGIIYHDNLTEEFVSLKSYYEDIAKNTILTNTLNISINPFKAGKFSPQVGFGISYNNYLSYSREVKEELYDEDSGIV
ncbi:MAG: hypothetical protein E4G95_06645 [Bacteroidia bacterium]|nr:MAG: hypothetical protein E4G95_06645 [Bacteroidia bacterium]